MPGDSITASGGVDEVEPVQQCVVEIRNELEPLPDGSTKPRYLKPNTSIYKVPALLKNLNNQAYEPQMVSFGPYHHGKEHLMPMEMRKHDVLNYFLESSGKPFESYVNALASEVQELKDCYDILQPSWRADTSRFLNLMVEDGCFMLDFLRGLDDSPGFGDMVTAGIKRDMLVLENQLPILVLVKIDQVENGGEQREEFIQKLVLRSFGFWKLARPESPLRMGACLHVLDMYRKTLILDETCTTKRGTYAVSQLWSAIELTEAGIRLEAVKFDGMQKTISFNINDGVLRLPSLMVNHTTESKFLNLIAFDGLHVGDFRGEVTSYIYFLRQLIKSPRDVSVLVSSHILDSGIGNDEAIVQLFDSLSKEVPNLNLLTWKMLKDVYAPIAKYREKPLNRVRAYLFQAYHESTNWSPLAYLSIIAAILLFILSFLQTWYTIYPYYHPRN